MVHSLRRLSWTPRRTLSGVPHRLARDDHLFEMHIRQHLHSKCMSTSRHVTSDYLIPVSLLMGCNGSLSYTQSLCILIGQRTESESNVKYAMICWKEKSHSEKPLPSSCNLWWSATNLPDAEQNKRATYTYRAANVPEWSVHRGRCVMGHAALHNEDDNSRVLNSPRSEAKDTQDNHNLALSLSQVHQRQSQLEDVF